MSEQHRSFIGNVSALALGGITMQAVSIISLPVLSRLFAPEAFGFQAVFLSVISILVTIASLRYELAIMIPADEEEAAAVTGLSIGILTLFTAALCILTACAGKHVFSLFGVKNAGGWIWLIPAGVFLSGYVNIFNYRLLRRKKFALLSGVRVTGKTGQTSTAIGFGFLGFASGGMLLVASLLEWTIQSLIFSAHTFRGAIHAARRCTPRALAAVAGKYSRFPLYSTGSSLLNMVSLTIPTILIATLFGLRSGGLYSRALALVQVPAFMLGSSIRDAFFQRASAMHSAGEDLSEFVDGVVERLTALILLPMLMVALIGPELFIVVAGGEWGEAGVYSRLLAPWIFCSFMGFPLSVLFLVRELQHVDFIYNVLFLTARVTVLFIGGIILRDASATILLFGLTGAAFNLWVIFYSLRICGVRAKRFVLHTGRFLLYSAPSLCCIAAGKWLLHLPPAPVVALAFVISIPYLGLVVYHDAEIRGMAADIWRGLSASATAGPPAGTGS